ncbi:MAG: hypothetical protein WA418_04210 [Bradyrhizobium sp.]
MARGKQPSVSHALPKQQTLLDCFLEAQAKRTKRRRTSASAPISVEPPVDQTAADDVDRSAPTILKPLRLT